MISSRGLCSCAQDDSGVCHARCLEYSLHADMADGHTASLPLVLSRPGGFWGHARVRGIAACDARGRCESWCDFNQFFRFETPTRPLTTSSLAHRARRRIGYKFDLDRLWSLRKPGRDCRPSDRRATAFPGRISPSNCHVGGRCPALFGDFRLRGLLDRSMLSPSQATRGAI